MIAVARRISDAAATFKTHALAAAHVLPATDIVVEKFLATRATWQRSDLRPRVCFAAADLIPTSINCLDCNEKNTEGRAAAP
jgi:hypothetical protein